MAAELFALPPVNGYAELKGIIDPIEERLLIAAIDACDLAPFRFQGWEGKRLTASFGWSYDFTTGRFTPGPPLPRFLLPVRERMANLACLEPMQLEQAMLIRYDPGAGIGWHRDRPQFEHVVGLSLGSSAVLRLRRRLGPKKFERASVELSPRGVYHLAGEVRRDWEHSIAPGDQTRWSITFRSLSDLGRRVRGA